MGKDLKAVFKILDDMEKRMKFNENRIKMLVDSMTSSKDIEKSLDVLYKKMNREVVESQNVSSKTQRREIEMSEKLAIAREKEMKREYEKQDKMMDAIYKEHDKIAKDAVRKAEMVTLQTRVIALEAQVKALSK